VSHMEINVSGETNWSKHWRESYGGILWKTWSWRVSRAYKILLRNVNLKSPSILELGAGSGINSLTIAKILKARKITLVDFNEEALKTGERTFKNTGLNVKCLKRDIFDLDLEERFDIVHSEGLLEHFYGRKRVEAFKKHVEFCKEKGFIIIFVPFKGIQYTLSKIFSRSLNKWIWNEEPFSLKELLELYDLFNLKILGKYVSPLMHEIGILARKNSG
jgi:ubiquinone/menaquinone biosynthesis C-methylase UbiE